MLEFKPKKELVEYGKVPPHDKALEESILATLLLYPNSILKIPFITVDMFYYNKNRHIFEAIKTLQETDKPIDILTVSNVLKKSGKLEEVGDSYALIELSNNNVGSDYNMVFHGRILQQFYIKRELIRIGGEAVVNGFDDQSDALDVISKHELEVTKLIETNTKSIATEDTPYLINEIMEDVSKAENGKAVGESTYFKELDEFTTFEGGMVYLLAGRPGSGKSSLALAQFAKHILEDNKTVLFSPLEMPSKQVLRWLAMSNGVEQRIIKYGNFYEGEREHYKEVMEKMKTYKIHFTTSNILHELMNSAKLVMKLAKPSLWVVDYVQQILIQDSKRGSRNDELDIIMTTLKSFAKKYDVPILVLSQLNREVEKRADKIPQLSDLRDSGALEQLADVVMFAFRGEYYTQDSYYSIKNEEVPAKGIMRLIISKNKDGITGDVYVRYKENLKQFYDYETSLSSSSIFDFKPNETFDAINRYESKVQKESDVF